MSTWWSAERPMNRENGIFEYTSKPVEVYEPAGSDSTKALVCKSVNNLQVSDVVTVNAVHYDEQTVHSVVKAWLLA